MSSYGITISLETDVLPLRRKLKNKLPQNLSAKDINCAIELLDYCMGRNHFPKGMPELIYGKVVLEVVKEFVESRRRASRPVGERVINAFNEVKAVVENNQPAT